MKPTSDSLGILSLEPGEKLYHYTSITGVKGICSKEFWATKSGYLNDRAEFQVAADVFSEIMHDCMRNDCALQHLIRKVMDNVEEWQGNKGWMNHEGRAGSYVVSFSLEYDNALMWSEYSSFLGYCMCFDYERLMSNFVGSSMPFDGKVVYRRSEQKKIMERAIEQDYFSKMSTRR